MGRPSRATATARSSTLLLQYDFSLHNLLGNIKTPKTQFWGDGPDLAASFFMMFNAVSSDDKDMDGVKKIKYGADLLGTAGQVAGHRGALRSGVQPNSKIPEQSFGILSPRIVFRTAFVTHEEISFQYSRYMYNQRACPTATPGCTASSRPRRRSTERLSARRSPRWSPISAARRTRGPI